LKLEPDLDPAPENLSAHVTRDSYT